MRVSLGKLELPRNKKVLYQDNNATIEWESGGSAKYLSYRQNIDTRYVL